MLFKARLHYKGTRDEAMVWSDNCTRDDNITTNSHLPPPAFCWKEAGVCYLWSSSAHPAITHVILVLPVEILAFAIHYSTAKIGIPVHNESEPVFIIVCSHKVSNGPNCEQCVAQQQQRKQTQHSEMERQERRMPPEMPWEGTVKIEQAWKARYRVQTVSNQGCSAPSLRIRPERLPFHKSYTCFTETTNSTRW